MTSLTTFFTSIASAYRSYFGGTASMTPYQMMTGLMSNVANASGGGECISFPINASIVSSPPIMSKVNGVVYLDWKPLYLYIVGITAQYGKSYQMKTMGTLPAGWRPSKDVFTSLYILCPTSSSIAYWNSGGVSMRFLISSTGTVAAVVPSNYTKMDTSSVAFRFYASYIAYS